MQKKTAEILAMLDEIFAAGIEDEYDDYGQVAREIWNVLSALRGPDTDKDYFKADFTVPIRRAAFPKMAELINDGYDSFGPAFNGSATYGTNASRCYTDADLDTAKDHIWHYFKHCDMAARVLGLLPNY